MVRRLPLPGPLSVLTMAARACAHGRVQAAWVRSAKVERRGPAAGRVEGSGRTAEVGDDSRGRRVSSDTGGGDVRTAGDVPRR